MLQEFAKLDVFATGYDISTPCLGYAVGQGHALGLAERINVLCYDMATASFNTFFDGAYSLVGSFTYLLNDKQIKDHLLRTAENLKNGAVYIIQMRLTPENQTDYPPQTWSRQQGDVEVTFTWGREGQDFEKRINHDYSILKVKDQGEEHVFEEKHPQRLWTRNDFIELLDSIGCFTLSAIYDIDHHIVPLDHPDLSGFHIPYFVLKKL